MLRFAPLLIALFAIEMIAVTSMLFLSDNSYDDLSKSMIAISSICIALVMLRKISVWDVGAIAAFCIIVGLAILYGGATLREFDLMGPLGQVQRSLFRTFLLVGAILSIVEMSQHAYLKARSHQWR